jgi:hypothetical protein
VVPQRQRRRDRRRDVVGHEGVEGHGDHARHLPPSRPVQRVRGIRGGEREVDDAVDIASVLMRRAVFWDLVSKGKTAKGATPRMCPYR